jgi:hypothetical protein
MHVDNLFGTKNLAGKAGDAVLAKLDHRQEFCWDEAGLRTGRQGHGLHVDHVGRANIVANPATGASFQVDTFDHAVPKTSADTDYGD